MVLVVLVAWAFSDPSEVSERDRKDLRIAHETVLSWYAANRRSVDFSILNQLGEPRALLALKRLERDLRVGWDDRAWATVLSWWSDTPFAEKSPQFSQWLFSKGSKVLVNFQIGPEDVQAFLPLAVTHFEKLRSTPGENPPEATLQNNVLNQSIEKRGPSISQ